MLNRLILYSNLLVCEPAYLLSISSDHLFCLDSILPGVALAFRAFMSLTKSDVKDVVRTGIVGGEFDEKLFNGHLVPKYQTFPRAVNGRLAYGKLLSLIHI